MNCVLQTYFKVMQCYFTVWLLFGLIKFGSGAGHHCEPILFAYKLASEA